MTFSPLSVYIHIPFCAYRCSYCDFNTYTTLGDLTAQYCTALCVEIGQAAAEVRRPVSTVFFGGGTPSLLSPTAIEQIMQALTAAFDIAPTAEITMEMNPESVDLGYLTAVHALGINRISFGAQSAVASELALLGRGHSFESVIRAVTAARQAGFTNLNIDLIYAVPYQTVESWKESLDAALALDTDHLSLYALSIEPGTPMQRWLNGGQIPLPDPDLAADQYALAQERLANHGLEHYEISNWARPGYASQHNLAYWRNLEYLGLGAGAHGHAAGYRYHVVKQPRVYVRRLAQAAEANFPFTSAVAGYTQLSRDDQMGETMMMGLRLLQEGVSLTAFEARFGRSLLHVYGTEVAQLSEWGLLEQKDGRLRLTPQAYFLSNQVLHRFL